MGETFGHVCWHSWIVFSLRVGFLRYTNPSQAASLPNSLGSTHSRSWRSVETVYMDVQARECGKLESGWVVWLGLGTDCVFHLQA